MAVFSLSPSLDMNSVYTTVKSHASVACNKGVIWIKSTANYLSPKVHSAWTTFLNHASTVSQKGGIWVKNNGNNLYLKFLEISAIARTYMYAGFTAGIRLLWDYKVFIISGVVIGAAVKTIYDYWKNRPQYPVITMESSANLARLSVQVPKEMDSSVNATLTFCVDLSSSMLGDGRDVAVRTALHNVLKNAQEVVDKSKEANIGIAIVGFNSQARIIAKGCKLLPKQEDSQTTVMESLKKKVNKMVFSGDTNIIDGLVKAAEQIKSMQEENKNGSHALILLTDGEQSLCEKVLRPIQNELALANVALFAIGIGNGHNKQTLKKIATSSQKGFRGTYIDTTGKETIESAVSIAYSQTVKTFHDLVLTAPQLAPGSWSVINAPLITEKKPSCSLGSLAEGEECVKVIKIHGDQLSAPLELAPVTFELAFTDPKGKQAKVLLPWNPNTILNPEILKAGM